MSPAPVNIFDSHVYVNQQDIPTSYWQADVGTYGQLGRIHCRSSIKAMFDNGITDFNGIAPDTYTPMQLDFNGNIAWGGSYFCGQPQFKEDEFEFFGRDFAAVLFDTKRSLADLQLDNITVSQLVTQLGQQYDLDTDVQIDNDPLVGTVVSEGARLANYPQPIWNLLVYLARMTGAEVYTDQFGTLHFLGLNQQQGTLTVTYKEPPDPTGAQQDAPVLFIDGLHQPQRNRQFAVVVKSYHQKTVQTHTTTVSVAGQNIAVPGKSKTIPAGFYTGTAGYQVRNLLSAKAQGMPIYEFREDGLTPDLVQARAEGYAREIAKRLMIWTIVIDGDPTVRPLQRLNIREGQPGVLAGYKTGGLWISSVKHTMLCPQEDEIGGDNEGYFTTIVAMSLPPPMGSNSDIGDILGGGGEIS